MVHARPARRGRAAPAAPRLTRPPAALSALLVVVAIVGVAWALVTPAFQAPDENSHFGYVQTLAERLALPGQPDRPPLSREQIVAGSLSNSDQAAQQLQARMEWSRATYERWRARAARLPHDARTDGGGGNPASSNPPLYYLYESIPYRIAEGGDLFARLTITRLASVLWLLLTVAGVWLLAGEVFARDRLARLAAAGTAGLLPMVGFVSASLNPDAALFAFWSFALWLGVRLLRRGVSLGGAVALFAVVGAACVVKATSYALVPGAVFALTVALWRVHGRRLTAWLPTAAGAAVALVATLGVWFVIARLAGRAAAAQVTDATGRSAGFNLRELLSYLWQFYLPKLPFQTSFPIPGSHLPVYDIWLSTGWAAFGWLEVRFPDWVYVVFALVSLGVAGLALAGLWRVRRRVDLAVVAFLALVALTLLAGLHWTEYRMLAGGQGPFNNGRYLLPLVGVAGLAVATALRWLRPAARSLGVAGTLAALLVLNVLSLGLCLERFYA